MNVNGDYNMAQTGNYTVGPSVVGANGVPVSYYTQPSSGASPAKPVNTNP